MSINAQKSRERLKKYSRWKEAKKTTTKKTQKNKFNTGTDLDLDHNL